MRAINTNLKKHIYPSIALLLTTWLMTGLSVDDEFYDEYRIFMKYRPAVQYYFRSPLGMQDMPVDYPADRAAAYYTYRDFVLEPHWSSGLDGLAICLVFGTAGYVGFVALKYVKNKKAR